jgi:hypothetical protein
VAEYTDRQLAASIGGYSSWAVTEDRSARTAPARAGFEAKFLAEADGDPQRAASLRAAFYQRMQLKSRKARAARRAAVAAEAEAEAELAALAVAEVDDADAT